MNKSILLVLLITCRTLTFAQPISIVFDPPKEILLGGLDTIETPYGFKAFRRLDLDLNGDRETLIQLLKNARTHASITSTARFASTDTSTNPPLILTTDSLSTGSYTFQNFDKYDLLWPYPWWDDYVYDIQYLPFSLPIGSGTEKRYGWITVQWIGSRYYLHGWQLQDLVNIADTIGTAPTVASGQAAAAFAIAGIDIGESGSSADLRVRFRIDQGEIGVAEYRVLVVPTTLDSFDLSDALLVPSGNYRSKIPDGTIGDLLYGVGDLDVMGNPISQNVSYRIMVLSIPDGILATLPTLVLGGTQELRMRVGKARNVVLEDIVDPVTCLNWHLQFEAPADESKVLGYWCGLEERPASSISIPDTSTTFSTYFLPYYESYTVEDILALPLDRRIYIPRGSGSYAQYLPINLKTTAGNSVKHLERYRAIIVTQPDTLLAQYGDITQSDFVWSVSEVRIPPSYSFHTDDNHEDGRLLKFSMDSPPCENWTTEYRVYAIPESAGVPTVSFLLGLPDSLFLKIAPTGASEYTLDFENTYDILGNPIVNERRYRVPYILLGDTSTWPVSIFSNLLSLPFKKGSIEFCEPSPPNVGIIGGSGTPADLRVIQSRPADAIGLQAIRVAIVPADSLLSEETMYSLPTGRYIDLHTTPIAYTLPAGLTDAYGNPLLVGAPYRMQSQFIPDWIRASITLVSLPSANFMLDTSITSVNTLVAETPIILASTSEGWQLFNTQRITEVAVYNTVGHQIYSSETQSSPININASFWPAGVYIIRVQAASKSHTWRVFWH